MSAETAEHSGVDASVGRLLTVPEAMERLRVSRSFLYGTLMPQGLPVVRFGVRIFVPERPLEQWLASRVSSGADRREPEPTAVHQAPPPAPRRRGRPRKAR